MNTTIYADQEVWKAIEGYESLYQVSSHGRVRSLDRIDSLGRLRKGRIRKMTVSRAGYYETILSKDGKVKKHYTHRIVAKAFCGGFVDGLDVCHNDGNPANNHYTNLRWDTRSNNMLDCRKHGTKPGPKPKGADKSAILLV